MYKDSLHYRHAFCPFTSLICDSGRHSTCLCFTLFLLDSIFCLLYKGKRVVEIKPDTACRFALGVSRTNMPDEKHISPQFDAATMKSVMADSALQMVTVMGEGVALLDLDGCIRKVNPAFAAFAEYEGDELVGRQIQQLLPEIFEEDAQTIEHTLVRVSLKRGMSDRKDALHAITPKGGRRWVVPSLTVIKTLEGAPAALVLTVRDITTLVDAQEARVKTERIYRDRVRRLAERLASTREEERRDIATQLHDTVVQSLSLCSIRLGALRDRVVGPGYPGYLAREMDEIRDILNMALGECRTMLSELTPPLLYELGLGPAVHDLVEKYENVHGTSIRLNEESGMDSVPPTLRGVLFESIRELVVNAVKHAGDCLINIHLNQDGDYIIAEVCDNGKGFDWAEVQYDCSHHASGFGLFNVRERILHAGGSLNIRSAPGQGTTAVIRVPLRANG